MLPPLWHDVRHRVFLTPAYLLANRLKELIWADALSDERAKDLIKVL